MNITLDNMFGPFNFGFLARAFLLEILSGILASCHEGVFLRNIGASPGNEVTLSFTLLYKKKYQGVDIFYSLYLNSVSYPAPCCQDQITAYQLVYRGFGYEMFLLCCFCSQLHRQARFPPLSRVWSTLPEFGGAARAPFPNSGW